MTLSHTAFFGDGEHTFNLTDDMIAELERIAGLGIGALYLRAVNMQFKLGEMMADKDSLMAGLGLGLGFMVYNASDRANVRGYNVGLHFTMDF